MEQTKATENLSQWFNLDEQTPWEPGVYEVQRKDYDYFGQFSLFKNGKFHEVGVKGPDSAIYWAEKFGVGDGGDVVKWRGLSSDPNAKPKPKARGNRKVTRWLHFTGMLGSDLIHKVHGVYKTKKEAEIARDKRNSHGWRSAIRKIRFRTPEAD